MNGRTAADWLTGVRPAAPLAGGRVLLAAAALFQAAITGHLLWRVARPPFAAIPYFDAAPSPSPTGALVVTAVWVLAAIAFGVGFRTRASGGVLAAAIAVGLLSDQQAYSNHTYLLAIAVALLSVADAGAAGSLDARRGGTRTVVPAWPVMLVLAQITIVYLFTAASKLNADFLSGAVLRSSLRLTALEPIIGWKMMMAASVALSIATIVVEVVLAVGLWRARWRPALFAVGFALHLAILLLIAERPDLTVFGLTMLGMYLPLLDAWPASRVVVWDGTCSDSAARARRLRRLDWFGVHVFRPSGGEPTSPALGVGGATPDRALQLYADDRHHTGFAAVGRILEMLPLTCWVAAVCRLPVVRDIGERTYGRHATQRD